MKEAPFPPVPGFFPDDEKFHVDFYVTHPDSEAYKDVMMYVHSPKLCEEQPVCGIHKPTPHHMVLWPRLWSSHQQFMWRLCPHKLRHPDPDEEAYREFSEKGTYPHHCDGCCTPPGEEPPLPF